MNTAGNRSGSITASCSRRFACAGNIAALQYTATNTHTCAHIASHHKYTFTVNDHTHILLYTQTHTHTYIFIHTHTYIFIHTHLNTHTLPHSRHLPHLLEPDDVLEADIGRLLVDVPGDGRGQLLQLRVRPEAGRGAQQSGRGRGRRDSDRGSDRRDSDRGSDRRDSDSDSDKGSDMC